jgi:hypothetical protein
MCKVHADRSQKAPHSSIHPFQYFAIDQKFLDRSDMTGDETTRPSADVSTIASCGMSYDGVQGQGSDILAAVWVLFVLCLQFCVFSSHTSHSEAAASTAPMPLKSPGFVISICTGYFHSMYLAQPIILYINIHVSRRVSSTTDPNRRLYGQSTCPGRAQAPL